MRRTILSFAAAGLLLAGCGDDGGDGGGTVESPSEVIGDADEGIEGVQAIRIHYPNPPHRTQDIDYGLRPPAGGLHAAEPWRCGFYDEPVRDENVGHTLEHGAVWLSYRPGLAANDIEVIHAVVRRYGKVVAAPYEGLDAGVAVVATAWTRQLTLDDVDDPRLVQFVERYIDGPTAPEQGVSCTGGLGDPSP